MNLLDRLRQNNGWSLRNAIGAYLITRKPTPFAAYLLFGVYLLSLILLFMVVFFRRP